MSKAVAEAFPRNGQDVAYDFSQDPSFGTTISADDYKKLEEYMGSRPGLGFTGWVDAIAKGASQMLSEAGTGIAGLFKEPTKAPANIIEGATIGTIDLKNLLTQSTDPDSVFFKTKSLLSGAGSIEDRRLQFMDAAQALADRQKIARGEETASGIPLDSITPETAQGLSNLLDATVVIPGVNIAGFGAKAGGKVVGGVLKATGKTAKFGSRTLSAVMEGTGKVLRRELGSDVDKAMAEAAGMGARIPIVSDVLGTLPFATKQLGEAGQMLESLGKEVGTPGRLGVFERIAADEAAGPLQRVSARVASNLGGDFVLDITPRAVGGVIEGATIGGGLGYLSGGEEGAATGIGAGVAGGLFGSVIGRLAERRFGAKRNQDVAADFDRAVGGSGLDEIQTQRLVKMVADAQSSGVDVRASMADFLNEARNNNINVTFVKDSDTPAFLKEATGQDIPSSKFKGLTVVDVNGRPNILLNVDRADTSTAFHELFETLIERQLDQSLLNIAGRELFGDFEGETIDGVRLNKDAAVSPEQVTGFVERYAGALEDPAVANLYRDALAKLQDAATPLEERIKARAFLTRELLAYRAGAKVSGGKKGYQDALLKGKINGILDSVVDFAKRRTANDAKTAAALDFTKGIEPAFFDEKGNLKPAPTADSVIDNVLGIKTNLDPDEVIGSIPVTPENIAKLTELGIDPARIKKTSKGTKVTEGPKADKKLVQEVVSTPATPEESAAGIGSVLFDGESAVYSRGLSEAQMIALGRDLPAAQYRRLKQINDALRKGAVVDDAGNRSMPIFEATHVPEKPTYAGIPISTRNKIVYAIEFNKKGQIYYRVIDVLSAKGNLNKLFKQGRFSGAYDTPAAAYSDLIGRYLQNLDSVNPKASAEVLGDGNATLGEKRRNLLNAAMRYWPSDSYFNLPDANLVEAMKKGELTTKSMRNDRMLFMRPTGEVSSFSMESYGLGKRNYQPSAIGDKTAFTNPDGFRVIEGTRGWRAYSPDGKLSGIHDTLEAAFRAIDKAMDKNIGPSIETIQQRISQARADLASSAAEKASAEAERFTQPLQRGVNVMEAMTSTAQDTKRLNDFRIQEAYRRRKQFESEKQKRIGDALKKERLARETLRDLEAEMESARKRALVSRIRESERVRSPQQQYQIGATAAAKQVGRQNF
jgi:hypothetical protein